MFPFDYTDYHPQQTFLPNLHSSQERTNLFHHQNYLPNQMGIILPQTLNQDPSTINIINQNQDTSSFNYNPNAPYELFTSNNQASLGLLSSSTKKDRHTKISTAHGVRDRRVRLSMAIAREFFDLQDLLGFDKASKTIGWLLAKSKAAIQELVITKRGSGLSRSNSLYDPHEEDAFANSEMGIRARNGSGPSTFVTTSCNETARYPQEESENQSNSIVVKKNRTKARARARERTKEKLSIVSNSNQFDDLGFQTSAKTGCCSSSHLLSNEFKDQDFSRSLIEKEGCSADLQSLNGSNFVRNRHSSSLIGCTDYLQSLQSTNVPTSDQDGSVRVNNLPNLLLGSEYNTEPSATSFSGWNIFTFPTEMNMNGKQWGNQAQKQSGST